MTTPTIFARLCPVRPAGTLAPIVGMVLAALSLVPGPPAQADATPKAGFWITDGSVYASVLNSTTLYLGGDFSYVGPNTGASDQISAVTAKPATFPRLKGQVHSALFDSASGSWYVGGTFTADVGGGSYANLVHITPTATAGVFQIDAAFDAGVDGDVRALALSSDGKTLYVGGSFANVNVHAASPVARNNIAALKATNGAAAGWDPDADGEVDTMVLSADNATLYVGGAFTALASSSASPVTRNHIAALSADTTQAVNVYSNWNPDADAAVDALVLSSDGATLYAGGAFTALASTGASPVTRNHIAALSADVNTAAAVSPWDPQAGDDVYALSLTPDDSQIYLGGRFLSVGGKPRQHLARVSTPNTTTTTAVVDDTWTVGTDGAVYALRLLTSNIVVGGGFKHIGGQQRHYLAQVNISSVAVSSWDPSAENIVRVLAVDDSTSDPGLLVGGDFTSVGGAPRNNLAALNTVSFAVLSWDPDVDGIVRTIAAPGGAVFIGGDFQAIGGAARNHFGAVAVSSGTAMANWSMNVNGTVYALAVNGSTLYAGGAFTKVGSQLRTGLAAFDIQGAALTGWSPSLSAGTVNAVALSADNPPVLYAGGNFTLVNASATYRLAAVDTKTAAFAWTDQLAGNAVTRMALSTDSPPKLYAGGDFATTATSPCTDLAVFNPSDGSQLDCLPAPDKPVDAMALAVDNVLLYIGGGFTTVGAAAHNGIAALSTNDKQISAWDPAPGGVPTGGVPVRSVTLANDHGTLYMGGDFQTISGASRRGLAAFAPPVSKATPPAGPYNSAQNVTLSCTDRAGASCSDRILYSTDGSVPTTAYASGSTIPVQSSTTLKFYATDSEHMREVINTLDYVIDSTPPTASASPDAGTYTDVQNVTLTCTDKGGSGCAAIYYTTDGSVPDVTSTSDKYSSAISLSSDTVLKFIATDAAGNQSQVYTKSYSIDSTAPTTTPSPPPGTYTTPQTVTLSCDDGSGFGCAATYYTVDGSVPNTSSPRYIQGQPIPIDGNTTLNYFSVDKAGHQESPVTAVYLIQTGTVVTSGGGLFLPPGYLLGAWLLALGRSVFRRRHPS